MYNESFNPVYNSEEQVIYCASFMLKKDVHVARVAIFIGHNGVNFVSSTDWEVTTVSGERGILTFSARTQYPSFWECRSGVSYKQGKYSVITEEDDKPARVIIGDKAYEFALGEVLKIYINHGENFIATDCQVTCEELENVRIYRVITNDDTLYGNLGKNGRISQI